MTRFSCRCEKKERIRRTSIVCQLVASSCAAIRKDRGECGSLRWPERSSGGFRRYSVISRRRSLTFAGLYRAHKVIRAQ